MTHEPTLEQLEQQVVQLPLHEQLILVAHISERLSHTIQTAPVATDQESARQQRAKEDDELLALCDTAAEMWQGEFDAAEEIR